MARRNQQALRCLVAISCAVLVLHFFVIPAHDDAWWHQPLHQQAHSLRQLLASSLTFEDKLLQTQLVRQLCDPHASAVQRVMDFDVVVDVANSGWSGQDSEQSLTQHSLRTILSHVLCPNGTCCGTHSAIRARRLLVVLRETATAWSWIQPMIAELKDTVCFPEVKQIRIGPITSSVMLQPLGLDASLPALLIPTTTIFTKDAQLGDFVFLMKERGLAVADTTVFLLPRLTHTVAVPPDVPALRDTLAHVPDTRDVSRKPAGWTPMTSGTEPEGDTSLEISPGPLLVRRESLLRLLDAPSMFRALSDTGVKDPHAFPFRAYSRYIMIQQESFLAAIPADGCSFQSQRQVANRVIVDQHDHVTTLTIGQWCQQAQSVAAISAPFVVVDVPTHSTQTNLSTSAQQDSRMPDDMGSRCENTSASAPASSCDPEEPLQYPDSEKRGTWVIEDPPADDFNEFPCGRAHARTKRGYIPSPGIVDDRHSLETIDSAMRVSRFSPQAVANAMCWLNRDRPLYERVNTELFEKELPGLHVAKGHRLHDALVTVDVVYTFVRGSAPSWLSELHSWEKEYKIGHAPNRFRDWDELKFSLRSLFEHLCHSGDCCGKQSGMRIGTVYIVVASVEHIPPWLEDYKVGPRSEAEENAGDVHPQCRPELRIITHDMIYPGSGNNPRLGERERNETRLKEFLPTFHSLGIETCLHRIPGISRYFLYLNNDFLFGAKVHATDYFRPVVPVKSFDNGGTRGPSKVPVLLEPLLIVDKANWMGCVPSPRGQRGPGRVPEGLESECAKWPTRPGFSHHLKCLVERNHDTFAKAIRFNMRLAFDRLDGYMPDTYYPHVPRLLERNMMTKMLEHDFRDIAEVTRRSKFRSSKHLLVVYFYTFYAAAHRRARRGAGDLNLCRRAPLHGGDSHQLYVYRMWTTEEVFSINTVHNRVAFLMAMSSRNIQDMIKKLQAGQMRPHMFTTINDDFPASLNSTATEDLKEQFGNLMHELTARAPPSPWETQT